MRLLHRDELRPSRRGNMIYIGEHALDLEHADRIASDIGELVREDLHTHTGQCPMCLLSEIIGHLRELRGVLAVSRTIEGAEMKVLDELTARVRETETLEASAIDLMRTLSTKIEALKTDPAELQALADELRAKSSDLAAAIVANTPADPALAPPANGPADGGGLSDPAPVDPAPAPPVAATSENDPPAAADRF